MTALRLATFTVIGASLVTVAGLRGAASVQSSQMGFVNYLKSPSAALVAFSPTNHDPRRAPHYRAPNRESLSADLSILRRAFDGLILYGFDPNITPIVLSEMARLKYSAVMLGIWDPKSGQEVSAIVDFAKQYSPRLAIAIVVGNEGLAFNRYTFDDVLKAADGINRQLGQSSSIAISTSEPFSEYGLAELRGFGDFLAPNIHPVFDRPELGPVEAVAWVRERAMALAETARKPVLVKETGFPHGERFSPRLQAEFWAEYVRRATFVQSSLGRNVWVSHSAAFESFDLDWKAEQSGLAIENSWGLINSARVPYPAFFVWESARKSRK